MTAPRGPIVLRQSWSRGRFGARLASMPPWIIGMEAYERCVTQREERGR